MYIMASIYYVEFRHLGFSIIPPPPPPVLRSNCKHDTFFKNYISPDRKTVNTRTIEFKLSTNMNLQLLINYYLII